VFALSALSAEAHAACYEDTIRTIGETGDIVILVSGEVFMVDPGDAPDAATWLSGDDVMVCMLPSSVLKIVNIDENGESVEAEPG